MKDVLFIDNYDSYSYNILQMLEETGASFDIVLHDHLDERVFGNYGAIMISPGPGLPDEYQIHYKAIHHCVKYQKKYLGICLGLQSLVCFFGGKLQNLPIPAHGIRKQIRIMENTPLFRDIPSGVHIGLYHSWHADLPDLPSCLRIIATSYDGIIMAVQHETLPLYAVQFHPESFMTEHGMPLLNNWIQL